MGGRIRQSRTRVIVIAMLMAAGVATLAGAQKDEARIDQAVRSGWSPYAIGLWGDLPYSPEQETVGVPNLIADMNAQRLAFTVHDGDLKQGSNSPCDAALYARQYRPDRHNGVHGVADVADRPQGIVTAGVRRGFNDVVHRSSFSRCCALRDANSSRPERPSRRSSSASTSAGVRP